VLLDDEVEELHGLSEDLFSLSRINNSICWQQSRAQWLGEGDANTKKNSCYYVQQEEKKCCDIFSSEWGDDGRG